MSIQLYNTLTSQKEPFEPIEPGHARIYVCGPTVYDFAHIGHARFNVVYDVLVRHLRERGLKVTYVRNVTDIDDKIVNRARERGEDSRALAERFFEAFSVDMERLGNLIPDIEPKVTDHLDEIRQLVTRLIERGHAYESDGDVYFHVPSFPEYGKLSHRKLSDLEAGASERTEESELRRKKNPFDFALWKKSDPGDPSWPSPWSDGRPGWHIECSAMSMRYLGESFDLHGGGLDLVFPHHENEIAQSEAATGKRYVKHWVHNGFLQVNKEKMSKSLGNFFVLREAFNLSEPESIRYALLAAQYRAPLNLDWEIDDQGQVKHFPQFAQAEERLEYLYTSRVRLSEIDPKRWTAGGSAPPPELSELGARMAQALDDDLNTPAALAHVAAFFKAVNDLCDRAAAKGGSAPASHRDAAELGFAVLSRVLGIGQESPRAFLDRVRDRRAASLGIDQAHVSRRIADRAEARKQKDFATSDAIRAELQALGVEILDSPQGTTWKLVDRRAS